MLSTAQPYTARTHRLSSRPASKPGTAAEAADVRWYHSGTVIF
jgi:hypothetical protein